jgi:hypothetical protein
MNYRIYLSIIFLIVAATSCKKDNNFTEANKAVVECFLQPGMSAIVKITKEIPFNGDSTLDYALQGLNVTISSDEKNYSLKNDSLGFYTSNSIPILPGKEYKLSFLYNGFDVNAITSIPYAPSNVKASATTMTIPVWNAGFGGTRPTFPDPIKISWDNPMNDYHYVIIKNIDTTNIEIEGGFKERRYFTTSPDQSSSININFNRFHYYGKNVIMVYTVQSEYVQLYNTVGMNSQNVFNVPSNVKNGLGIFTGVNSGDSLFVEVN